MQVEGSPFISKSVEPLGEVETKEKVRLLDLLRPLHSVSSDFVVCCKKSVTRRDQLPIISILDALEAEGIQPEWIEEIQLDAPSERDQKTGLPKKVHFTTATLQGKSYFTANVTFRLFIRPPNGGARGLIEFTQPVVYQQVPLKADRASTKEAEVDLLATHFSYGGKLLELLKDKSTLSELRTNPALSAKISIDKIKASFDSLLRVIEIDCPLLSSRNRVLARVIELCLKNETKKLDELLRKNEANLSLSEIIEIFLRDLEKSYGTKDDFKHTKKALKFLIKQYPATALQASTIKKADYKKPSVPVKSVTAPTPLGQARKESIEEITALFTRLHVTQEIKVVPLKPGSQASFTLAKLRE